ncbi:hypothetical protein, partial [Salipaludibacillus sp. CF4.18]|uniref:hypothetical protein n=1 Tax=Salipaludibacillus sp. CF4.18 TaxID=3373081 RepID=UPI003EE6D69D
MHKKVLLCEEDLTVVLTSGLQTEIFTIQQILSEFLAKNEKGILNLAIFKNSKYKMERLIKEIADNNKFIKDNYHRLNIYQPSQKNNETIINEANIKGKEDLLIIYGTERLC